MISTDADPRLTYWERIALTRWGSYVTSIESRAILRASDIVSPPSTALEIGCEGGRWSKLLSDRGWSMVCTDINEQVLSLCKERIPAATCIRTRSDDTRLPCADSSVRLLLCIEVAPVVQADWFICEASRVLESGGAMVVMFWNRMSLRGFFAHQKAKRTGSYDYYTLNYRKWRQLLQTKGFQLMHEEGFCWFPLPRASNSALVPLLTGFEKFLGLRSLARISPWVVLIARKLH